jgi:hypothetical protein
MRVMRASVLGCVYQLLNASPSALMLASPMRSRRKLRYLLRHIIKRTGSQKRR